MYAYEKDVTKPHRLKKKMFGNVIEKTYQFR